MKKLLSPILLALVIFAPCQKAEAESSDTSKSDDSEQEEKIEIAPIKLLPVQPKGIFFGSGGFNWFNSPSQDLVAELAIIPEPEILAFVPQASGIINDTRVRLRTEPNLESETLEFLNTGNTLITLAKSAKQQQVDDMKDYWYKVQVENYPVGWVYGAFIDFMDYEIMWTERDIEYVVRKMLDKPDGIIMKSDLDGIRNLEVAGQHVTQIYDILHFENLTGLTLNTTYIRDLSPLYGVPNLIELYVRNNDKMLLAYYLV